MTGVRRKLTVDLRIEAYADEESYLAPLVVDALREFIEAAPETKEGAFESGAGLDVSWTVRDECFDGNGNREPIGDPPMDYRYDPQRDVFTIEGIAYAGEIFRQFGGLLPEGAVFRLDKRDDGVLTITRIIRPGGE